MVPQNFRVPIRRHRAPQHRSRSSGGYRGRNLRHGLVGGRDRTSPRNPQSACRASLARVIARREPPPPCSALRLRGAARAREAPHFLSRFVQASRLGVAKSHRSIVQALGCKARPSPTVVARSNCLMTAPAHEILLGVRDYHQKAPPGVAFRQQPTEIVGDGLRSFFGNARALKDYDSGTPAGCRSRIPIREFLSVDRDQTLLM